MSQGFWLPKGVDNANSGDMAYGGTSRVEAKRSHQWFMDDPESDLLPNKKLALDLSSSNSFLELLNSNPSQWGVAYSRFGEQLFDSESARMMNYEERGVATIGPDKINMGRKVRENLFVSESSFALSMSHMSEDPGSSMSCGGARKVKLSEVKVSEHIIPAPIGHDYVNMSNHLFVPHAFVKNDENPISLPLPSAFGAGDDSGLSLGNTHGTENSGISIGRPHGIEHVSASIGQTYSGDENRLSIGHVMAKEQNGIMYMGQGYQSDCCTKSMNHMYNKESSSNSVSVGNSYNKSENITSHSFGKGQSSIISFGGCDDESNSSSRIMYNYELMLGQPSLQMPDTIGNMGLVRSDGDAQAILSGVRGNSKRKDEQNMNKKSPSNNFPSNVRSLLSTGILDGVHVKYIAWSREKELRGIIRGCGYLCGCPSCNYTKVINAYEFERHADCKTKHPNNHIYFENGKTIYGAVQELRSAPQHMLFEIMQTITGSPINQKSFHLWKESYLAATQELQRVYGKHDR